MAQSYAQLVLQADSLYTAKHYAQSTEIYASAFRLQQKNGNHLYNAACSAALSAQPDQAFLWLEAAFANGWANPAHMLKDADLTALHADARWADILSRMQAKEAEVEAKLDKPLRDTLVAIFDDDQKYRLMIDSVRKNFGRQSAEMGALWRIIQEKDSLNLLKVKSILDRRGWVGRDLIGSRANQAIFLVIQHADQKTQEHYLPMMREAAQKGNASLSSLALLEDRVALGQGNKQVYGSQIGYDKATDKSYVLPLDDPDHVDERRAAMGLGPLADYVRRWGIIWDAEVYKKQQAERAKKD
ncbi:MAG TPA: hypothetical protein PK971_04935 [Saprospiraceae bacterium]|nr:hypothetical protein [Saprospiraceae bacterium]